MIHLRKGRFPMGTFNKLKAKKMEPFHIKHKVGDNALLIFHSSCKFPQYIMSLTFSNIIY